MSKERELLVLHYPVWYRIILWVGFVILIPGALLLALMVYAGFCTHQWFLGGMMGVWAAGLGYLLVLSAPMLLKMNIWAELTGDGVHIRKGYPARLVRWQEFGEVQRFVSGRRYLDRQGNEIFTLFSDARGLFWLDLCLRCRAAAGRP